MLLTYVDESYTDDWFAMAALLVDGPEAVTLTDELNQVATAAEGLRLGCRSGASRARDFPCWRGVERGAGSCAGWRIR